MFVLNTGCKWLLSHKNSDQGQFNTDFAKRLVFYKVSCLILFRDSFGDWKNDDGGGGGGDNDNESVTKSNGLKPKRKRKIFVIWAIYFLTYFISSQDHSFVVVLSNLRASGTQADDFKNKEEALGTRWGCSC